VLGGHSIDDAEPKFGMVAVGEAHPDRLLTNAGARPGDVLVLTKPIGSGVIATAIKAGAAPADVVRSAVDVMAALNKGASEAALAAGVRGGTDVTGFGLLGHLHRMLEASGVSARLRWRDVPLLPGAPELAAEGHVPGGSTRNAADLAAALSWGGDVPDSTRTLLADAQTSGGLLLCVATDGLGQLLGDLAGASPAAAVVGVVEGGPAGTISIV
jgi:selenide,water dikinase